MTRTTLFLLLLSLVPGMAFAQAGDEPATKEPAGTSDEKVVAWFKGEPVTMADLKPDPRTVEMNRKAWDEANFKQWKKGVYGQNLTQLIMGTLLMEYREAEEIEPTADEIDRFVEATNRSREEANEEFRVQRDEFRKRLKEEALSESERERLEQRIETLESILSMNAEREEFARAQWGEDYERQQRKSQERVAKQMITDWKTNRSLYERYGGRVIFQQAGPEPVDAYRRFLEEHRDEGTFRIVDPKLREQFWRYYVNDRMHNFYDEEDGRKLMESPWWELDEPLGGR